MSLPAFIYNLLFIVLLCLSKSTGFLLYGETCDPNEVDNPDLACDPYKGLTCRAGICNCLNPSDMILNSTIGGCSTLIGGNCKLEYQGSTIELPCVPASDCRTIYDGESSRDVCECMYNTSPIENRESCKTSHSGSCKETLDCNEREKLVCSQGFCQCPNPLKHGYPYTSPDIDDPLAINKCFALVGSPCNPSASESEIQCQSDAATCIPNSNSITGSSCACDESQGWLVDFSRYCERGYQQSCNHTKNPIDLNDSEGNCNNHAGLFCSGDKCLCRYAPDQIWDEVLQVCASTEGSPCDLMDDGANRLCYTGLECIPVRGPLEGMCQKPSQEATTTPKVTTENSEGSSDVTSDTPVPCSSAHDLSSTTTTEPANNGANVSLHSVNYYSLKYLVVFAVCILFSSS